MQWDGLCHQTRILQTIFRRESSHYQEIASCSVAPVWEPPLWPQSPPGHLPLLLLFQCPTVTHCLAALGCAICLQSLSLQPAKPVLHGLSNPAFLDQLLWENMAFNTVPLPLTWPSAFSQWGLLPGQSVWLQCPGLQQCSQLPWRSVYREWN